MIDRMKSAGFGEALDKKAYFGFLKILCGIQRIDHALYVFKKMKQDGCDPGIKTYDLLMGKLYAHNRADRTTALFNEAHKPVTHKPYQEMQNQERLQVQVDGELESGLAPRLQHLSLMSGQPMMTRISCSSTYSAIRAEEDEKISFLGDKASLELACFKFLHLLVL
ncbi:hypothetical protein ACLB2K_074278 [Fragaria x ananassa]